MDFEDKSTCKRIAPIAAFALRSAGGAPPPACNGIMPSLARIYKALKMFLNGFIDAYQFRIKRLAAFKMRHFVAVLAKTTSACLIGVRVTCSEHC